MSAAARAEARRKAILSRGTDRLAKLTTSARGDDPAYKHDDPPLPSIGNAMRPSTSAFLGEESNMPTPPQRASPSPSPSTTPSKPAGAARQNSNTNTNTSAAAGPELEPGVWSTEQQQLMQALMSGMLGGNTNANAGTGPGGGGLPPSLADNPLAALLMSGLNGAGAGAGAGGLGGAPPLMPPGLNLSKGPAMGGNAGAGAGVDVVQAKPKTLLQRLMPLVHVISMWGLLAYFALFMEPQVHEESVGTTSMSSGWQGMWSRWAELAKQNPLDRVESTGVGQGWTVNPMPFFWAFITLQIGLHSVRIFSGFDRVQPPMLLSMALPHLPAPIPSVIINGMKYFQMATIFLDDYALVAVGMGFLIWLAGLFSS
ncbi:hypothetical protein D9758_007300 [Tetrapyrgos nigripes]|uniref:Uncharacterized protein n=1 Tax=Tetrapyrgos nigripes TaxID=182062 RepID=A0A8H5LLJ1_9AGAR|nr:hypothetical protein D9758_007300 [Tetrapyrgos nigripes]